jgi:selenide, water dikinase
VRLGGDERRALVLTADVIGPLVDDAETFGAIAATNALSDVYAMGGRPLYALNLAFFPDEQLPLEVLRSIMRGAARTCAAVGVPIVGGHTVRNADVKYGLAVTGEIELGSELSNRRARAGQVLVLTKALGTGIIAGAIKAGTASVEAAEAAVSSMFRMNDRALVLAREHDVSACTDVTGFGLLGHLRNILLGSELSASLSAMALPILPGAEALARAGKVPGGTRANLAFVEPLLGVEQGVDAVVPLLAADAQTSGGLLLCVDPERAAALVAALVAAGHRAGAVGALTAPTAAAPVGHVTLRP